MTEHSSLMDSMTVSVPEGELDGLIVERFVIPEHDLTNLRNEMIGRGSVPGEYTMLIDDQTIWMSDTMAERRDHLAAAVMMRDLGKRVLINGLGLGMLVQAALAMPNIEHIDVVESDPRVVALVGPHYTSDPRVHIIRNDAFDQAKRWPRGSFWQVIWSDIWPTITSDNLPDMARLKRAYARRCNWHACWCQWECLRMREHERLNSAV